MTDLPAQAPWDEFRHPRRKGPRRTTALRAYARIIILSKRGMGPRSEKGSGAQRWERAHEVLYQALQWRPTTLADQMKLERWAYKALGFRKETGRFNKWQRPVSRATIQRQISWMRAVIAAIQSLPDWCQTPEEIDCRANELLAT